jgi:hypothetical protein
VGGTSDGWHELKSMCHGFMAKCSRVKEPPYHHTTAARTVRNSQSEGGSSRLVDNKQHHRNPRNMSLCRSVLIFYGYLED